MKKLLFLSSCLIANIAVATNLNTVNNIAICDKLVTNASVNGIGSSTSTGAITTGATTANNQAISVIPGGSNHLITGNVETFSAGRAINVSTGNGAGSVSATGEVTNKLLSSVRGNLDPAGINKLNVGASIESSSANSTKASTNQNNTSYGANAAQYEIKVNSAIANNKVSNSITDTKVSQSIVKSNDPSSSAISTNIVKISGGISTDPSKVTATLPPPSGSGSCKYCW